MKAVGNSVIGMRRTNNEDAIYINEQKNLKFFVTNPRFSGYIREDA